MARVRERLAHTVRSSRSSDGIVFKVLILKNVRRGAHQPEANSFFASIAIRKCVPVDQNDLVRVTVLSIVHYLVNS